MIKENKLIFALCIIIALLVGYIFGSNGSTGFADIGGGDVAVLLDLLKEAQRQYEQLQKHYDMFVGIKNLGSNNLEEQISQTKILAASIGNEDLLKLVDNAAKVINMSEGDWFKLVKGRLSDIIPGLKGKIVEKDDVSLNSEQKTTVTGTVNVLIGSDLKKAGISNNAQRVFAINYLNNQAVYDSVKKYFPQIINKGAISSTQIEKENGSISRFITDEKRKLHRFQEGLNYNADKAPLTVQLQLIQQLLLMNADINLRILEVQNDTVRLNVLRHSYEFGEQLKEDFKTSL